ncbi:hypothetical protein KKC08_01495 [Patescibacteria group bacterium]|nr:hypothetical protein [Patescibacteria group bacterium]MCG2702586.1 hypothetical protein [Candidatus Parcubacteria bacterium]MBU4264914.1 hypothetical protein [Patescibacteria group bacterium]MBU4390798.1 hypothetical protein [Patescibacteria group bacterium]MBU4396827.1 hypothetical protein [Patescibacteria group bacterium]
MKKTREIALYLVIGFVIISSVRNSIKQILILSEAKKENKNLENRLEFLKEENILLKQKLKYASSSAFVAEELRDKFGLGGEDDYWLVLPEIDFSQVHPKLTTEEKISNWKKWMLLW